ncbi:hemolysin III family protein [Deferribacter thermophilus]|uniref:PAQR family membrane homeostasis protein TrhA n=1 Tax=Deferribacter thermophilus TaxID=53573 RepID=UPI003C2515EC
MIVKIREPINSFTHFIGSIFSFFAFYILISKSTTISQYISFSIYVLGMFASFTASAVYHAYYGDEKVIFKLRKLDHVMIYVFIASTYTPVSILVLEGKLKWLMLFSSWIIAIFGFLLEFKFKELPRYFSTLLYVMMGWIAIFAIKPLYRALEFSHFMLLLYGGIFYTIGALIYATKKPNFFKFIGFHEIFHIFVLLGSFMHFLFMLNLV